MRRLGQFVCWLIHLGHDFQKVNAQRHLYLECVNCGRQTTGWTIKKGD